MPSTLCILTCMESQGCLVQIPLHNFLFKVQWPLLVLKWGWYPIWRPISTPNSVFHYFIRTLSKADPLSHSIISVPGTIISVSGTDPPLFWRWFQQPGWLQPAKRHFRKIKVIKQWNQSLVKIRNFFTGNGNGTFTAMVIAETREMSNGKYSVEWL